MTALLLLGGRVSRLDGVLLLAGLVAYTAFTYRMARRQDVPGDVPAPGPSGMM